MGGRSGDFVYLIFAGLTEAKSVPEALHLLFVRWSKHRWHGVVHVLVHGNERSAQRSHKLVGLGFEASATDGLL